MNLPLLLSTILSLAAVALPLRGGVVINEFQSAPNTIVPEFDSQGMAHVGYGPSWWEPGFYDADWLTGNAPLGHSTAGLGKDLGTSMDDKTPSLYVRKRFTVPAAEAAATMDLILRVWYDDGFVAYINGREAGRMNLGPARQITYQDQVTYRASTTDAQPVEINLGPLNNWLVGGENVLAIQVHNRDLGSTCRIDASLTSSAALVSTVLRSYNFDDSNGASRIHQRNGPAVTNSATGIPPAESWLTVAADPVTSPDWPGVTIGTTLAASGGRNNTGALVYSATQTGGTLYPAVMCTPEVNLAAHAAAGALSGFDLSRVDVSFIYRTKPGSSFGFRVDPQPGDSAQALGGFPNITTPGTVAEDPVREFADVANGTRTRTVNAGGTGTGSSSGILKYPATLEQGPALKNAAFRCTESAAPETGANGSTGALRFELTDAPDSAAGSDYFQFALPGFTVRSWTPGAVTAADLTRVNLTFSWNLPAGLTYRVFLEPDSSSAGYADRADFGTLTGTGSWASFDQSFATATNTAAALARLNSLGTASFRIVFRGDGQQPVNQPLWVDNLGFTHPWRSYSISLGSASAATQTAFLSAMNATARTSFTPVFTRITGAVSPATDTLTVDDFRITVRNGGTLTWVNAGTEWRYFIGRCEPSGGLADPADFADPLYDGDWSDWLELYNDGTAPVNLTGWSLTDDPGQPARWTFPAGTSLPAGGYLLVLCDDRATPPANARYLHANFELSTDGEHLSLRDASGTVVSDVSGYPRQNAWNTWGVEPGGTNYGFLQHGTPGRSNSGPFFQGRVKTPDLTPRGGFYPGAQTVSMVSETAGAVIRYTVDGSDPTETSALYTGPLTLNMVSIANGHVLRARAFLPGRIPSDTKTETYLINQDPRLRSAPALIITGDPGRSLYAPYGITAISGGARDANGVWSPTGPADYNNVLGDMNNALTGGQAWERPFNIEWRYADGREGWNEAAGMRVSGSGHARPRYVLNNIQNAPWSFTSYLEKPSWNIFFRNEYGNSSISHPMFPKGYPVETFEQLRVRAGKNDVSNPFVKDEFMRRVYINCGQQGSRGLFNTLYVNGKFRGTFNVAERLREPFMQQHFNSIASWDVRQVTEVASGDATAFNSFVTLLDAYANNQTQANYDAATAQLDVTAYIDYALVNIWGGTGDWPHNNYVASRERSSAGKWRWFVWDAEGAFGGFSKHLGYNVITQDFLVNPATTGREICRVYDRLSRNAEFRMQFADRIHRHFCNGGALTDARLTGVFNDVFGEYQPLFNYMFPSSTLSTTWFTNWVHAVNIDKRDVLFRSAVFDDPTTTGVNDPKEFGYQFPLARVWPATDGQGTWVAPHPPKFNQHGGDTAAGFQLSIYHTEPDSDRSKDAPYRTAADQSPANRTIYYTLDGADPRLPGGIVSPSAVAWTAPVPFPRSFAVVKSRIRDSSSGEWSPLTEASFRVGTAAPTAANLVIAEIMYHPQSPGPGETLFTDSDEYEFIRLLNISAVPVRLSDLRFAAGIGFDFASGSLTVLDPGKSAIVCANTAAFRARYGTGYNASIAGEYTGTSLSNSGERLRLETQAGTALYDFSYSDSQPWPESPDGGGPSLLLKNPQSAPDPAIPENWVATARPGGHLDTAPPSISYERWRTLFWNTTGVTDASSASNSDWDGDGLTNFAEYSLGWNPLVPHGSPVRPFTGMISGEPVAGIEFTTLAGASDSLATPEYSTDLTAWQTAPVYSPAVAEPDGTLTRRAYAPPGAGSRVYLRVRFSAD